MIMFFKQKTAYELRIRDWSSDVALPISQIFGAMRVAGTVIWATDLNENKQKSGGGKGRPSVTSYSYSVSFAVAISSRPILRVGRIWADGNLLRGMAGDFKTELGAFRLFTGDPAQNADQLMASAEGAAPIRAHRGFSSVVFDALQLADYGKRIPTLDFDVFAAERAVGIGARGSGRAASRERRG